MAGCCAQDEEQSPAARWLPKVLGMAMILAGAAVMLAEKDPGKLRWEKIASIERGSPDYGDAAPRGNAQRLVTYRLSQGESSELSLSVAEYPSGDGLARAMVFPAGFPERSDGRLRHDLWQEASDKIQTYSPQESLFVSWWDNGQRISYATQRPVWVAQPSADAYSSNKERGFWSEVAGTMAEHDANLQQLARWLTMDANLALAEMQSKWQGRSVYLLICLDDLARLGEIERLAGSKLPLEFKLFPPAQDLHSQISSVKSWAAENGTGNYLVQQTATGEARAWRISTEQGASTLLARLLPFTSSLAKPLDSLALVYQSAWGAYLSIYQLNPRGS